MASTHTQLLYKIAWLYHNDNLSQSEIGEKLGFSSDRINQMLKEARETGILEIKFSSTIIASVPFILHLCQLYGLQDVVCTPPATEGEALQSVLAQAAAEVLEDRLQAGMNIGIGIGRTIARLPDFFRVGAPVACNFVSLTGGLDLSKVSSPHSYDTVSCLAHVTGGRAYYIPAPSFMTDADARSILTKEKSVHSALELARACQAAVFSVGVIDETSLLYLYSALSPEELADLKNRQVVGDLLGRFFDSDGQEMDIEINRRAVGLHIDELKSIPLKILVAGGERKRNAIRIALSHQMANILVTDLNTAERLLEYPNLL